MILDLHRQGCPSAPSPGRSASTERPSGLTSPKDWSRRPTRSARQRRTPSARLRTVMVFRPSQPRENTAEISNSEWSSFRGADQQGQAFGIDQSVDLAPLHLLAGLTTHCVCFTFRASPFSADLSDYTTADDAGAGARLPPQPFAQGRAQFLPDRLPHALRLEGAEDVVDRRARREDPARQTAPRATGPAEDRGLRSSPSACQSCAAFTRRNQLRQALPFRIGQIARQTITAWRYLLWSVSVHIPNQSQNRG